MEAKNHLIVSTILFFLLWLMPEGLKFPDIVALIIFTLLPDLDLKFGVHRHFLFHSILMPLLWVLWYGSYVPIWYRGMFLLSISVHLLCDIHIKKEKQKGFYCIKWNKKKGLNGRNSTIWLLINSFAGIIVSLITLIL